MSQRKIRGVLPTDPELAPGLLVVVPDLNTWLDAAYAYRVGQEPPPKRRDPRVRALPEPTITPPGENTLGVGMIPLGLGEEIGRRRESVNQSLAFFDSLGNGCYGMAAARHGAEEVRGVPLLVCTSGDALDLLATKLIQKPDAADPERRGFGWTGKDADDFIDGFVLPYVKEENGGLLFSEDPPPLGADIIGGEDGRILGITQLAYRRSPDRETLPVVVTRDRGFIAACNNPSLRRRISMPAGTGVLSPKDYTDVEKVFSLKLRLLQQRRQAEVEPETERKAVRSGTPSDIPGAPGVRIDPRAAKRAPNPMEVARRIQERRRGQ